MCAISKVRSDWSYLLAISIAANTSKLAFLSHNAKPRADRVLQIYYKLKLFINIIGIPLCIRTWRYDKCLNMMRYNLIRYVVFASENASACITHIVHESMAIVCRQRIFYQFLVSLKCVPTSAFRGDAASKASVFFFFYEFVPVLLNRFEIKN